MTTKEDFLLEIGCAELPARFLNRLSQDLGACLQTELHAAGFGFNQLTNYATPRRIAVLISGLDTRQPDQDIERHGPFIKDAYDKDGTPTLACIGFARSSGVSVDQLQKQMTDKGERVCVFAKVPGAPTKAKLADIVKQAIKKLPLPKPMRFGEQNISFLRPVHWIVMLFGKEIILTELLGQQTGAHTRGHRFHHPKELLIREPAEYEALLHTQGYVIANFAKRRDHILDELKKIVELPNKVRDDVELTNEVTNLVEWPIALKGKFNPHFLKLPPDVLITTLKTHQKCFPVIDSQNNNLLPNFIIVSNIHSKEPNKVIKGNERVVHARLSDALFFYQNDCKKTLESRLPLLDSIMFQNKLGSIGEKVKRLTKLSLAIAKLVDADNDVIKRGALLAKCDLVTDMVREFPNLQGTMGYYYALHDKEPEAVAQIINQHYLPRFSGDILPTSLEASIVALSDRLDTLVGIIGINQKPTGDKDPYALRRAAQGVVRILIDNKLDLDLVKLIQLTIKQFPDNVLGAKTEETVYQFILERLKYWYIDSQNCQLATAEIFESVASIGISNPLDFDKRIKAVLEFRKLPAAETLIAANKRVSNILKKQTGDVSLKINAKYFEFPAETELCDLITQQNQIMTDFYKERRYTEALTSLACLEQPIATFFETVMVMDENEKKRNNRLALLATLRDLFSRVADISLV